MRPPCTLCPERITHSAMGCKKSIVDHIVLSISYFLYLLPFICMYRYVCSDDGSEGCEHIISDAKLRYTFRLVAGNRLVSMNTFGV